VHWLVKRILTLGLCSSLNVIVQVPKPYKTRGINTGLNVLNGYGCRQHKYCINKCFLYFVQLIPRSSVFSKRRTWHKR